MAGREVENLVLIPGALARDHAQWQRRANALAADAVLIVLPVEPGPQRDALERIARTLETRGRQVTIVHVPSHLQCVVPDDDRARRPLHPPVQLTFDLTTDDLPPVSHQSQAVI